MLPQDIIDAAAQMLTCLVNPASDPCHHCILLPTQLQAPVPRLQPPHKELLGMSTSDM